MTNAKDYAFIILGLGLYAFGFCAFILPYHIVIGGLSGVGTLVFFASNEVIPVAVTQYVCNMLLLASGYKLLGRRFVVRTVFGASIISLFIGLLETPFMSMDHPLMSEVSISAILGGLLAGTGVGLCFVHNGSSGGTDIVAAMVSKVSNVSIGRTMIFVDMTIVCSSLLLPFEGTFAERLEVRVPLIVYGMIVTFVVSYMADLIINTNRQATQFIIFSRKWAEIANHINNEAHRGVTVMDGVGWYTKHEVKVLMVWCRKIESVTIFRIVKSIDPDAFISQANVNGVYGKGFDTMRMKRIKSKDQKAQEAADVEARVAQEALSESSAK